MTASTPVSLLNRLRSRKPEAADWRRLQEIYQPLLEIWLKRVPQFGDEALDVVQEVFLVVIQELPQFERHREGSFRAWLRRVAVNRMRAHQKRLGRRAGIAADQTQAFLSQLEDPASDLSQRWNEEHDRHVFQKLCAMIQGDFEPVTWDAFRLFGLEGRKASLVAAELGISENAVLLAKSRVLKRLRAEATEFID